MSMVDKSMFSVMNMTKEVMQHAQEEGFLQEITMQNDGAHIENNDNNNDDALRTKYSSPLKNSDEITDAFKKTYEDMMMKTSSSSSSTTTMDHNIEKDSSNNNDPIDNLTVSKLKSILKAQKLKVSGTKKELQQRLRLHVQSMIDNK